MRLLLKLSLLPLLALVLGPSLALAQEAGETTPPSTEEQARQEAQEAEYTACMLLAEAAPTQAYERAQTWELAGGKAPAAHCAAVALYNGGQVRQAAEALEALSARPDLAEDLRAPMLAQAAQAWLTLGNFERAFAAQTTALTFAPNDIDLLLDRAVTAAAAENYRVSVEDLTAVLLLSPNHAEALILRATAFRYLDEPASAREDINRAMVLAPRSPEALLESGVLYRLENNDETARQHWQAAIAVAPDSAAAETARRNLELMDIGEDAPAQSGDGS